MCKTIQFHISPTADSFVHDQYQAGCTTYTLCSLFLFLLAVSRDPLSRVNIFLIGNVTVPTYT